MDLTFTKEKCEEDNNSIQQKIVAKSSIDSRRMEIAQRYRERRGIVNST